MQANFCIEHTFQLDECLAWILENRYNRVVVQMKREDLVHSVGVVEYLRNAYSLAQKAKSESIQKEENKILDVYVTQANTCCVDLIVTQHVSNVDAIIHLGKVCLSKPEIRNQPDEKPILFAFGHPRIAGQQSPIEVVDQIMHHIDSTRESVSNCRICVLYDTNLVDYATKISDIVSKRNLTASIEVAKLNNPSTNWYTTPNNRHLFIGEDAKGSSSLFGQFLLDRAIEYYNCAIYLGDRLSIELSLKAPSKLFSINCYTNTNLEPVNVTKLLNKRMALVGRLKDEEELKIGVIMTNPLPNITKMIDELESYAKERRHTLYFISMIQTIDECKIGNFDLCDAFIVINSCTCSTILESLVFNRPIINGLEFKLACGFEAEYGRVLWPGSSSHLTEEDLINKRKVSDVSLALVHTRNQLLERCSQARANKWSGMDFKANIDDGGRSDGGGGGGGPESLKIEEGLSGIASSYTSEPSRTRH